MTITIAKSDKATPAGTCTSIPFELVSTATTKQKGVPVCSGVCVPKGTLHEVGEWLVETGGAHLPAQTTVLNRWSDGSVRWMLVRFVAGRVAPGRTVGTLVRPDKRPQHFTALTTLRHHSDELLLEITDAHKTSQHVATLIPRLYGESGQPLQLQIESVTEDVRGDVCCVFQVAVRCLQAPAARLNVEMEIWPSHSLIRTSVTLTNTRRARHPGGLWDLGDDGSFHFGGLHLEIRPESRAESICWQSEPDNARRLATAEQTIEIVQHGSGGRNWSSSNHAGHDGQPTVRDRGYTVSSPQGTFRGYRSQPAVALSSSQAHVEVRVPEFWKQFPTSLSAGGDKISIGLFPTACGPYELQGGEQKTLSAWTSISQTDGPPDRLSWIPNPPHLLQSADWVRRCAVFDWLPESLQHDDAKQNRLSDYLHECTTGRRSFENRRATIDEFGWRNFGDVPADHEQTHYAGSRTIVSHYNNQFDLIFGGIQNLFLSGDTRWFDLFDPLARHVIDIDIYHTTEDRSCFNGGLFWHTDHYVDAATATHRTYSTANATDDGHYGGGPSNEHNYTTGLLYYYFLTGNPQARAAVVSLADWVISMDDGSRTIFGLLDDGPTGLASQTKFEDFHGPGRGVGNSINALLDALILTGEARYEAKLEQLIRRAVHPRQNCRELQLDDAENRWSYSVCMTALGRVLAHRLESGRKDELYAYIRATLENYGRWMADNERPSLSAPERLEFLTEAWAAQDFRKANALRIAASCTDDARLEARMRSKASELNDAAWSDLYQFEDRHLTARCLSILMTEGVRDVFHRTCRPEYFPPADRTHSFSDDWAMFVPQKQRVKRRLKTPLQMLRALPRLLHPGRWQQTVAAWRRHLG